MFRFMGHISIYQVGCDGEGSASRSVTVPMRESLMDSPVVTSLSPVEMVDVQSVMVMVRLAALWQL